MYSIDEIIDGVEENRSDGERSDNDELSGDDGDGRILSDSENRAEAIQPAEGEVVQKDEADEEDKPAKKVRKKSNRPTLNAERLKGPRGLICMEKIFTKLKFKGKGYEQQDLETTMRALQKWCHRLYPKFAIDDTLEQIEKLGAKKPVMTLRKKIVLDMLTDEIFGDVPRDEEDIDATRQLQTQPSPRTADPFDSLRDDQPPARPREPSPEFEPTEEQKQVMERNRMLAAERRKAKMEAQERMRSENIPSTSFIEPSLESNMETEVYNTRIEKSIGTAHRKTEDEPVMENQLENSINMPIHNTVEYTEMETESSPCISSQENVIENETETEKVSEMNISEIIVECETEKEHFSEISNQDKIVENTLENIMVKETETGTENVSEMNIMECEAEKENFSAISNQDKIAENVTENIKCTYYEETETVVELK